MPSYTRLTFRDQARARVLAGAGALTDALRVTLGPRSRSVLMARKWGTPLVCNDGVTIAKEVRLEDPEEDLGARMMREAAVRTGSAVGDGTTTAAVLAHAIFAEGVRNVVAGASAIELKRGLDRGTRALVEALAGLSRPVTTRREKAQVATVSAHNDSAIGEMVADAFEKVGSDGAITVEEAKGTETVLEVVEGLQFDRGYLSPYFVNAPDRMEVVLESPLVLLHEKRISGMRDLLPLLEQVVQSGKPLLVVAEDVDGDALATLVINKLRGNLLCAAVKAPGFGDRRKAMLQDMAILIGGEIVSEELGVKLDKVAVDNLGTCDRVVIDRDSTTLVGGHGDREAVAGRCAELRRQIDDTTSDYDREKLEERLAKLSGGVAVIRVGAASEAELKTRKDAFDDAIASTRAAIAEGIVPGGGLALLRAADSVAAIDEDCSGDERTGLHILRTALEAPVRQIAVNSGVDAGVVVQQLRAGTGAAGFDAESCTYVDLMEAGIVDATKVMRVAVENAVSVASVLLLTEATLVEIETDEPGAQGPAAGMTDGF